MNQLLGKNALSVPQSETDYQRTVALLDELSEMMKITP